MTALLKILIKIFKRAHENKAAADIRIFTIKKSVGDQFDITYIFSAECEPVLK